LSVFYISFTPLFVGTDLMMADVDSRKLAVLNYEPVY